jgi:hypothetical protein
MGADIETGIPANVVEIGTEVTQGIIDALNTAPSPNATNRFAVINDLNLKANLAGATFSGKINCTAVGGVAGFNIGIGGTNTSSTVAGDMWISTGGSGLNYRDGNGTWRTVAGTALNNTFTGINTFPTQVATDNSTRVATTEFVRASVPTTGDWNLLVASITTGSPYNAIIRLVYAGNSTIVFQANNSIPVGAQWVFINSTAETRTFSAGAGANLYSQGNKFVLNGQYSMCTVVKMGINDYHLSGNLV